MLQKSILKTYSSLQNKKYRQMHGLFIVEGNKMVEELLFSDFKIHHILYLPGQSIPSTGKAQKEIQTTEITSREMGRISSLKSPPPMLGIVKIPVVKNNDGILKDGITLFLEDIGDPGNLGTIIRVADWFGIQNVIASPRTVDVYNPKVIQSCMGSIFRIQLLYKESEDFIKRYKKRTGNRVYGAVMQGANLYKENLSDNTLIILGNESRGISARIDHLIDKKITIPPGENGTGSESLNVAVAAGIICNEFSRASFLRQNS
ncbi:MAG: TrmH family RNA methyltransferase [Bacteroidales bacterium]